MAFAVCVGDTSTHGGTIVGPGSPTVQIGGKPAAVMGDNHVCSIPPSQAHPLVSSPFPSGSATVMFGGVPALRNTDTCLCGAMAAVGQPTVIIG
ncbi:MAG: PAAR domain-containing protein [Rhodocyclaceae bacterium]